MAIRSGKPTSASEVVAAARSLDAQVERLAELEDDRKRALKLADALTLETQSCEDAVAALCEIVVRERKRCDVLRELVRADRTGTAKALGEIKKYIHGSMWITEGRGPYEWDDERYKAEAGSALRAVLVLADDALLKSGRIVDAAFKPNLPPPPEVCDLCAEPVTHRPTPACRDPQRPSAVDVNGLCDRHRCATCRPLK